MASDGLPDYEKLGAFYLGKKIGNGETLLYDSRDLMTHAVCVGMTGSGKTGLCISLLEEAAIDGIPAIVIDPKGDLSNLLLTFPELEPEQFEPWVNPAEAQTKGISVPQFAEQQAKLWKDGLAKWDQDGQRIARLKSAADFSVYTPGSDAGIPVSVLKSFDVPDAATLDDREAFRDLVSSTASSLLSLAGITADPLQSREHLLLSTLLGESWSKGKSLNLENLIAQVQSPPVSKVGVMDLESFYPAKERFTMAMALNRLIAAPGFEAWMHGEPLNIDHMLYGKSGKPRISIFSIAHLNDAERMFFVSLILNQMLAWTRRQSGTASLRAMLYMDEIFGYFPPVANPPSKQPLLTLLKQARAYGVGIVLATQNPVDLDYKGLANTGTWFIGRLQTDRDKARVLDGLEGAASSSGSGFNRAEIDRILSGLKSRVFLMNNVHEDEPVLFETRWCLSYLRGPMSRTEIRKLMDEQGSELPGLAEREVSSRVQSLATSGNRPVLPPDIRQYFLPLRSTSEPVYEPYLLSAAEIHFTDAKRGIDKVRQLTFLTPLLNDAVGVDWEQAEECQESLSDLEEAPVENASYTDLPAIAANAKNYKVWEKGFSAWLFQTQTVTLLNSPQLKLTSQQGESERNFQIRLAQRSRELRDEAVDKLRAKYASKIQTLSERKRLALQRVDREKAQVQDQTLQTVISVGSSILGAFFGRKKVSVTNMGRVATAARSAGRVLREQGDVGRANETVESIDAQLQLLENELQAEIDRLHSESEMNHELEELVIRPRKTNIQIKLFALGWKA